MYCFKRKWPNRWQTALQDSFQRPHFGVCQQAIAPYFPAQMLLYRKKKNKKQKIQPQKCVDRCKQHQKAVVCVTFFSPAVYLAVSLFFRVLSWTRNLFGCVSVCARLGFLCLHLALAWRGREDWSERRWLMSAGQWAHGPVASDCHHGPVLARLWHAHAQSPVSTSHPPSFLNNISLFVCLLRIYMWDLCTGNALEPMRHSFLKLPDQLLLV